MADELTKIDLGGAAQELRDKIRSAFVDMIPPEQWAAMIQAELQAFTKPLHNTYGEARPSPLQAMMRAELERIVKAKITEALASPEWSSFDGAISAGVQRAILEHRDALIESMLKSMMGTAIQSALSQMRYGG